MSYSKVWFNMDEAKEYKGYKYIKVSDKYYVFNGKETYMTFTLRNVKNYINGSIEGGK